MAPIRMRVSTDTRSARHAQREAIELPLVAFDERREGGAVAFLGAFDELAVARLAVGARFFRRDFVCLVGQGARP